MNLVKELHLIARVLYTAIAVFAFSGLTGFSFYTSFMGVGWFILLNSFLWQYLVLHFALKNIATLRGRLWFLIAWCVVALVGLAFSMPMIPSIEELHTYASQEAFLRDAALWGSVFVVFSSAFVALTCTRRAWTRHGQLG